MLWLKHGCPGQHMTLGMGWKLFLIRCRCTYQRVVVGTDVDALVSVSSQGSTLFSGHRCACQRMPSPMDVIVSKRGMNMIMV